MSSVRLVFVFSCLSHPSGNEPQRKHQQIRLEVEQVSRGIRKGLSPITGKNHRSFTRLAGDSRNCQPPSGGASAA